MILFIFSLIYSNDVYINGVNINKKTNGVLLELDFDSSINEDVISAWQANSGWFYITLYKVKGDTINILKGELPSDIIEFQAIQGSESYQLGLRVKEPIDYYEFLSINKNIIVGSLYYSRSYFRELVTLKKIDNVENIKKVPRGIKKWMFLTGSSLIISGAIRENKKEKVHLHTKVGSAILAFTFIIDSIWKIL